jgi:hypothetical protein
LLCFLQRALIRSVKVELRLVCIDFAWRAIPANPQQPFRWRDMILCSLGGMKGNLMQPALKKRSATCLSRSMSTRLWSYRYQLVSTCAFWCLLILGAKLETWSISFSMVLGLMIYICVCWSRSIRSIRSIRSYKSKFHTESTLQTLCDRIEIGIPRPPQVEFIQMQRSARGAQSTAPSRHDMKHV